MAFAGLYLAKQAFTQIIEEKPPGQLRFIVVIPCYNEPFLLKTLDSLNSCIPPKSLLEVILVFNSAINTPGNIKQVNQDTIGSVKNWIENTPSFFKTHIINFTDLPEKYAGVGLARKIGMDEAVRRFNYLNNKDGVIISFDADATCDTNYFIEIEHFYDKYPNANGCTVYFEHPISGDEFSKEVYNGIIQYEMYLRYFIQGLKYSGYPFAFHTVGSCFTVKAQAYVKQGGMNRKKAGEDFYFLQKVFPLGQFYRLNTTRVIPSPRPSNRV